MVAVFVLTAFGISLVLSANLNDIEMRRASIGPSRWSDVKLNKVRSRRLLTHDANLFLLKRQHLAPTLATNEKKPGAISLFLIRVETRHRTEIHAELQRASTYLRYFSKDTFVAALSADILSTLSTVEVIELPPTLKMQPELYSAGLHRGETEAHTWGFLPRHSGTDFKCTTVELYVALISINSEASSIEKEIESLCSESVHADMSLCRLKLGSGSQTKRLVETHECVQHLAAYRLASHPAVIWVEIRGTMRLRNKYATRIVQSKNGSSWNLWEKGLKGEGEVVFQNYGVVFSSSS
jgi:hypothetical protein